MRGCNVGLMSRCGVFVAVGVGVGLVAAVLSCAGAVLCCPLSRCAVPCRAMLYRAALCRSMPCCAVLYPAVLCSVVLYSRSPPQSRKG